MPEHEPEHPSGFVCPRCGGALWEQSAGRTSFTCRIGDTFSALELWIEHCAARNQALRTAARELAENAALARDLVAWARKRGDETMAKRLEEEAASEDASYEQVRAMLAGLDDADDVPARVPRQ
jgi:hypothetical protein